MTREPSVDEIARRAEPVLEAAGIQAAYVFGSRAQGTVRAGSDVDVAVLAGRHVGLLEEQDLAAGLADCLGVDDVDVVVLDRAELSLRGAGSSRRAVWSMPATNRPVSPSRCEPGRSTSTTCRHWRRTAAASSGRSPKRA